MPSNEVCFERITKGAFWDRVFGTSAIASANLHSEVRKFCLLRKPCPSHRWLGRGKMCTQPVHALVRTACFAACVF